MEDETDNNRTPQNSTYHKTQMYYDVSWSGVVALLLFFIFVLALVKIIVSK